MIRIGNPSMGATAPGQTTGRSIANRRKFGIRVQVNGVTLVFIALSMLLGIRTNALLQEVRQLTTANHSLEYRFCEQQETAIAAMQKYLEIRNSGNVGPEVTEAAASTTGNYLRPWQDTSYEITSASGMR
jgi:hypothetical protein